MSHLKTTIRAIGAPINLVFCGLDNAGKTAMYIRLTTGKFVTDLKPTLASTLDAINLEEDDEFVKVTIIDLGGQKGLRDLWSSYLEKCNAIIYVVDAYDSARFLESKNEFQARVVPLIKQIPCIVVCNKLDLIQADSKVRDNSELIREVENTIQKALDVPKGDNFSIIAASQKTGYGLPKVKRRLISHFVK
ncbi:MAG: ADP-ribosylation factor-like protein [Candidatus Heimdallarchaeota archaeon]